MEKVKPTGIYVFNKDIEYLPQDGYNELDEHWYVRLDDLTSGLGEGIGENSLQLNTSSNKALTNYSIALGTNNIVGSKGFYVASIDYENKIISLSNDKDGEDVNVDISEYAIND